MVQVLPKNIGTDQEHRSVEEIKLHVTDIRRHASHELFDESFLLRSSFKDSVKTTFDTTANHMVFMSYF